MKDNEYLLKRVKEYLDVTFILKVYNFIKRSGVCPETTMEEWLATLTNLHTKGFLHYGHEGDEIKVVVGAFRIPTFDGKPIKETPEKEEGNILYVDFMASEAQDKWLPRRMLTEHINKFPIEKIVFYKRNSDDNFRIVDLKERENVKQETELTISARVL